MSRLLISLFPLVVVVPHLVPVPEKHTESTSPKVLPDYDAATDKLAGTTFALSLFGVTRPFSEARMDKFAETETVVFLKACLARYSHEVKGYSLTFQKQERIGDKL